jgi:hypothetical protein
MSLSQGWINPVLVLGRLVALNSEGTPGSEERPDPAQMSRIVGYRFKSGTWNKAKRGMLQLFKTNKKCQKCGYYCTVYKRTSYSAVFLSAKFLDKLSLYLQIQYALPYYTRAGIPNWGAAKFVITAFLFIFY